MIKCIFFDLDNTVYPEKDYYIPCYDIIAGMIDPKNKKDILLNIINIRETEGDQQVFNKIIEYYGVDNNYLPKFVDIYRSYEANISVYRDVLKFLEENHTERKFGILTNGGKKTQTNKVKCLSIEKYFDYIYITGEHLEKNYWKPHKTAFDLIITGTGYKPEELLYVGDSFEKDVIGAINARIRAIKIDRTTRYKKLKYNNQVYWEINSFSQINQVINEVEN
jgi:putative hydrolase of the HAD superfamily